MKWILFVYLSTFSAHSGMSLTTAEFDSKEACLAAAAQAEKEFSTFFTQKPKTLCVGKGKEP